MFYGLRRNMHSLVLNKVSHTGLKHKTCTLTAMILLRLANPSPLVKPPAVHTWFIPCLSAFISSSFSLCTNVSRKHCTFLLKLIEKVHVKAHQSSNNLELQSYNNLGLQLYSSRKQLWCSPLLLLLPQPLNRSTCPASPSCPATTPSQSTAARALRLLPLPSPPL